MSTGIVFGVSMDPSLRPRGISTPVGPVVSNLGSSATAQLGYFTSPWRFCFLAKSGPRTQG